MGHHGDFGPADGFDRGPLYPSSFQFDRGGSGFLDDSPRIADGLLG